MPRILSALLAALVLSTAATAQHVHDHPVPERLGTVSFPISCQPAAQPQFNRAVALLHSFAYRAADSAFQSVLRQDPACAIARWGSAMTHYHQLWDLPPSAPDSAAATRELALAAASPASTARERGLLQAVGLIFASSEPATFAARALAYQQAMQTLAAAAPADTELQVFYALALLSNASPYDLTHRNQKQALAILEPLFTRSPDHPGIAHYIIHACDNQELAPQGLVAARLYAGIAPSAPHALHMPSHIFTRLGLWPDSIASNTAARIAAQQDGDLGEELHAMDYLVYAYLQQGQQPQADQLLDQLRSMPALDLATFKVGYAATAMPVRGLLERQQWQAAEALPNPAAGAQPQVLAIAAWARGLAAARSNHPEAAGREAATLASIESRLTAAGNRYWAAQVGIQRGEVLAFAAQAQGHPVEAVTLLTAAADDEDAVEKLPLTPGPILPARELLGQLLLLQHNRPAARQAFEASLRQAPNRRNSLAGLAEASR